MAGTGAREVTWVATASPASSRTWRVLMISLFLGVILPSLAACAPAETRSASPTPVSNKSMEGARTADFVGRVVAVTDGDTIKVLVDGREQRIVRLAEIDAPEKAQPWGNRARQKLSELVFRRDVVVQQTDTDRYGRIVAKVSVEGRDVGRTMVASGAAWAFRRYLIDQSLLDVEEGARRQRIGLWAMPDNETIAPWDWRQGARVTPAEAVAGDPASGPAILGSLPGEPDAFTCGAKTRCREMSSCAEAQFYLAQCGVDTLDGNWDGEPCEQLCGTAGR